MYNWWLLRLILPQVTEKNIDAARESYRPVAFRDFGGERGRYKPRMKGTHWWHISWGKKCQWIMEDDPNMIIFTREDWSLQVPAGFYKTVRRRIPKFRNWKYIWYMLIRGGENHAAKLYQLLFLQSFYEFCHWGGFITRTWSPNSPTAYFIVKPKHSQRCFLT